MIKTRVERYIGVLFLGLAVVFMPAGDAEAVQAGGYDSPYLQADFTQELSDWTSALVNPALLYRVNQLHLGYSAYRWSLGTGDPMGFSNLSLFIPIRRNQTAGLTLLEAGLFGNSGVIERRDVNMQYMGDSRFYDFWIIGHYAARIPALPWLMLGTNIKLRIQRQFSSSYDADSMDVGTPGVDVGIYVNPFDHYRFGDLGISINLQDIVPAQIEWYGGEQPTVTRLRAGLRYSGLNDKLVFDAEMVIDNAFVDIMKNIFAYEKDSVLTGDTTATGDPVYDEMLTTLEKAARFSAHFRYQFIPQLWLKFGWNNNNIPYVGLNINLMYLLPEMINYLNFDINFGYSFIEDIGSSTIGDERGFTLAGKLSTDFGPTREQRESKRLYDKLILAPMDAYNEAMRLYVAKKYWEASFAFGKVLSLFPNFHLNDKASWYMGDCYHQIHLNSIARDIFKSSLEEYTTTEMRANYLYGLQRVDYREGKFEDALKNHAFIINLYPESDVKSEADYLAGQIHFERKNYNVAQQILESISSGSPSYLYAQYTLSIINIESNRISQAIQNLNNVIRDTTIDVSEQLLQDGANLKLGHLYFEEGDKLKQAVECYSRVARGTAFHDEALLGMSWAWIKVNQPQICLEAVDRLIASYGNSPLIPEAYLLKGYTLMLLKRYREAVTALQKSLELTKGSFVADEDLVIRTRQMDRTVQDFLPTAERIKKNALRKPTNERLAERPELQNEYGKYAKANDEYFLYKLLARSHTRFFKRKSEIIEDAEYALAKATNMLKTRQISEEITDVKKESEKIDDEIQRLEEEMKKLE